MIKKNLDFSVYFLISKGLNQKQIARKLGTYKQRINYYFLDLQKRGLIAKKGYGVYQILKPYSIKRSPKKIPYDTLRNGGGVSIKKVGLSTGNKGIIRGHAFIFTLRIPRLQNWHRRADFLYRKGITFTKAKTFGYGLKIAFKGRNIILYDRSIVIYEKSSYISNTAQQARSYAIFELKKLIGSLERILKCSFRISGAYYFKVSRHHYSDINNALARQYDKENKRLKVRNDNGLWFIIDNSFNLHEAETVHTETATKDMDEVIKPFFNRLKEEPNILDKMIALHLLQIKQNKIIMEFLKRNRK